LLANARLQELWSGKTLTQKQQKASSADFGDARLKTQMQPK
jgi:hypothetical protein